MKHKYQVVTLDKDLGWQTYETDCVTKLAAWAEVRGIEIIGMHKGERTRIELQGHPTFNDLCGPMYNGEKNGVVCIRYENWAAYDRMSA